MSQDLYISQIPGLSRVPHISTSHLWLFSFHTLSNVQCTKAYQTIDSQHNITLALPNVLGRNCMKNLGPFYKLILEGTARYWGLLLAPAESLASGQGFFCP